MSRIVKELRGRDVLKINKLGAKIAYGTTSPLPKDSPMKDKFYFRFGYQGLVFIVPEDSDFIKEHKNGEIYSVDLIETTDDEGKLQLSFSGHTNRSQEIKMADTESQLLSFSQVMAKATLTDADVSELTGD